MRSSLSRCRSFFRSAFYIRLIDFFHFPFVSWVLTVRPTEKGNALVRAVCKQSLCSSLPPLGFGLRMSNNSKLPSVLNGSSSMSSSYPRQRLSSFVRSVVVIHYERVLHPCCEKFRLILMLNSSKGFSPSSS